MHYFKNKPNKYYLYNCFKDYLPERIINSKKTGFSIPVYRWIKNKIKNNSHYKKHIYQDYKIYSMFISKEIYK